MRIFLDILDILDIETKTQYDGKSLMIHLNSHDDELEQEFYITECTWMRKHGWRTPEWKLIIALEPDFHFKPEVELYNLVADPNELNNLVELRPDMVKKLKNKMVKKKEKDGLTSQDLAWQEQRRKRKIRKLDFEVR